MPDTFLVTLDNVLIVAFDVAILYVLGKKLYKTIKKYLSRRQ